jgi:hypothetical protein
LLGWLAALGMFGLAAYVVPKRFVALWMKKRKIEPKVAGPMLSFAQPGQKKEEPKKPRSRVRPFYLLHLGVGFVVMAAVLGHAGFRLPPNGAGALLFAFWGTALLGLFGAGVYRLLPRRLSALERKGALPEDLAREKDALADRMHRALSGRSALLKKLVDEQLLPYAKKPLGWLALLLSGESLRSERKRLEARMTQIAHGQPHSLAGLDDVVRIAVEMRALPARRLLTIMLRSWLPIHAAATAAVLLLLVIHIVTVSFP